MLSFFFKTFDPVKGINKKSIRTVRLAIKTGGPWEICSVLVSCGATSTHVSGELLVTHRSSEPVLCSQASFLLTRALGLLERH